MVVQNKCKTLKLTYEVGGTDKNGCVVNDSRRKWLEIGARWRPIWNETHDRASKNFFMFVRKG